MIATVSPMELAAYQECTEWAAKAGDTLLQDQLHACHGVFDYARSLADMVMTLKALQGEPKLALRKPTEALLTKIQQYRSHLQVLPHYFASRFV